MSLIDDFQDPYGGPRTVRFPPFATDELEADINAGGFRVTGQKGEPVNLLDFGTTDADLLAALALAAADGKALKIPAGAYQFSQTDIPSDILITGDGKGATIIKAKNGAAQSTVFVIRNTVSNVVFRDLTLDGNRGSLGTLAGGVNSVLFIGGSNVLLDNVEVAHSESIGVFIGDGGIACTDISFRNCWIHDNGGTINNSGFGVGIFSGGAVTPKRITVEGCLIEKNYNTVTRPGDSTGVNLTVNGAIVANNRFVNNYNVNGGQIGITDGGNGTGTVDANIHGNFIQKTGSYGSPADQTNGIEVNGRGFTISHNVIDGFSASGINIEGSSTAGSGVIANNYIANGTAAIRLYGDVTDPITAVTVTGNTAFNCTEGINLNTVNDRIVIADNDFSSTTSPYTVFGSTLDALTTLVSISNNLLPAAEGRSNERRTAINGSPVSLTTITDKTVISLSLPRGVWDVFGNMVYNTTNTTKLYSLLSSISLTNNTADTTVGDYNRQLFASAGMTPGAATSITTYVPVKRIVLNVTTTIYLVAYAAFDTSTLTAYGKLSATKIDSIK